MSPREDYAMMLDGARLLAQRDLLAWWKLTEGVGFIERKRLLEEPFAAIVATYGEQAAYAAADYLFLQRSLDESLRELEYPEVAQPVQFEQARASFRAAMWVRDPESSADRALALLKLQGIANRLVAEPARKTVGMATLKAGTSYARVPEPGACAFCLMLGSRGAVYTKETVLGEMGRYHDNCRCLAIEVTKRSPLPKINRDLMAQSKELNQQLGRSADVNDWRQWVDASRQQAGQDTNWPRLKYCRIPRYTGDGMSTVFPGEKLPLLDKMPGHVLHGWRDRPTKDGRGRPHDESLADGHRWDSEREGASKFPKDWTDQKIVDAVRDTIEAPETGTALGSLRVVRKSIDGVLVESKYSVLKGGIVKFISAYPVRR